MNFIKGFKDPAESAGRTLVGTLKDVIFQTACVFPVLDSTAWVQGFRNISVCESVQNSAISYFLVVHKYAPKLAVAEAICYFVFVYVLPKDTTTITTATTTVTNHDTHSSW